MDRSSAKFVLVAMANCANTDMTCWPSVQYLAEATCQDRKTVLENLRRLREAGLIKATGGHKGKTAQVAVYQLVREQTQNRNDSEIGTVPKTDGKGPVFPSEESRFSSEAVPKTGHGTVKEPSSEPSGKRQVPAALEFPGVDPQVVSDFKAMRKAKKAPLTETALRGIEREAKRAGLSLQEVLAMCCERGWTGFKADWVKDRGGGKQSALEARNAETARKLKEMV